jgi:hypothetical protein
VEVARSRGETLRSPIVLVGGTALAGWLIAPRTTPDALMDRWNQLIKWHGDRHAILGFADALVDQLRQRFGCDPVPIIARLAVTAGHRALLLDAYRGKGSA